jgi:hypothetical protein
MHPGENHPPCIRRTEKWRKAKQNRLRISAAAQTDSPLEELEEDVLLRPRSRRAAPSGHSTHGERQRGEPWRAPLQAASSLRSLSLMRVSSDESRGRGPSRDFIRH